MLVIMIIILLILAGVTVSYIQGDNGLIKITEDAAMKTENMEILEEVKMVISEKIIQMTRDGTNGKTEIEYLIGELNGYKTPSGATITCDENGKITYIDKKGNETILNLYGNGKVELAPGNEGGGEEPPLDLRAPVVTIAKTTSNSIQFSVTDNIGVVAYGITENSLSPTNWVDVESTTNFSEIISNLKQQTTYYVWAKDAAGNVSEPKTATTKRIEGATETNLSGRVTKWEGATATVTFTTTTNYYIQTTTTPYQEDSWSEKSLKTVTIEVESGTTVYARLVDSSGQTSPEATMTTVNPILRYSIRYHANGGTGTMENTQHQYGTPKKLRDNTFTKTGYTFAGWATSETGEKVYDNGESVTNISSTNEEIIDLYAVWTTNKYTVTFRNGTEHANSHGTISPSSLVVDYGTTYIVKGNKLEFSDGQIATAIPNSPTGFTSEFSRWTLSYSGPTLTSGEITDNITIRTEFTLISNVYNITLDKQGAAGGTTTIYERYQAGIYRDSTCTIRMTKTENPISVPAKTGYTFGGYYTGVNGTGEQLVDERGYITSAFTIKKFSSSATLYAKWTETVPIVTITGRMEGTGQFHINSYYTNNIGSNWEMYVNGYWVNLRDGSISMLGNEAIRCTYNGQTYYAEMKLNNYGYEEKTTEITLRKLVIPQLTYQKISVESSSRTRISLSVGDGWTVDATKGELDSSWTNYGTYADVMAFKDDMKFYVRCSKYGMKAYYTINTGRNDSSYSWSPAPGTPITGTTTEP